MAQETKKVPLIRKTSKTFLLISFILMLISTVLLFFYVRSLLRMEIEEELFSTTARVETALAKNKEILSLTPVIEVSEVENLGGQIIKDTLIYDPSQKEMEEFRELTSFTEINGAKYKITVRNLIVETDDILFAIVLSYLTIIVLVFVFLFFFSKARNKKLWSPFFENLNTMKNFSLTSNEPIPLVDSGILEFSELNHEIATLTNKVRSDYKNLKQYTEDVSHELQTPLAIIQAKIENIINGDNLNDMQFEHLTSIQRDIQRLTQMNKRLALLTKIENNQFINVDRINMKDHIAESVANFRELSGTEIKISGDADMRVHMDSYLAEVLCNNLISNAIKHGSPNGIIEIKSKDKMFSISNSGSGKLAHPENLYARFYRESEAVKSTGLGLAIVKRICDLYAFEISYQYEKNKHVFTIRFK